MFKQFYALVRGHMHETSQDIADQNALAILRQQIRDGAASVEAARRAVALAKVQNDQEAEQAKRIGRQIDDLEARAISALEQGKDELAREAAETIARLEAEREASKAAQERFDVEIERLKRVVGQAEARLADLRRGYQIASAADKTQALRQLAPGASLTALQDAEDTLTRLRDRQRRIDATNDAMAEMTRSNDPSALSRKLAAAGCGDPVEKSADEVLTRLKERTRAPNLDA